MREAARAKATLDGHRARKKAEKKMASCAMPCSLFAQ
jgi:hypothetical protein